MEYCSAQRDDCERFKSCLWVCYESKMGAKAPLWHHASMSHLFVCCFLCLYGYLVEVLLLLLFKRRVSIQFTFQPYTSLSNEHGLSVGTSSIYLKAFGMKWIFYTGHRTLTRALMLKSFSVVSFLTHTVVLSCVCATFTAGHQVTTVLSSITQ